MNKGRKNRKTRDMLALILAGGKGERLHPLTIHRAKPAVPFGGKYRIIDFTLSNCINSGIRKIAVLTQYKSLSLNRHLALGWEHLLNPELDEFIISVPPQQRVDETDGAGRDQQCLDFRGHDGVTFRTNEPIKLLDSICPSLRQIGADS